MSVRAKRVMLIAAFLVIAAIAIALCVNYFTGAKIEDYEGTLVQSIASQYI